MMIPVVTTLNSNNWRTMAMCEIRESDIETIIDGLEDAIGVCHRVDSSSEDFERSYPFAAGYSRAAMRTAIENLRRLM